MYNISCHVQNFSIKRVIYGYITVILITRGLTYNNS